MTPQSLKDGCQRCRSETIQEGLCPSLPSKDVVLKQCEKKSSHCIVVSYKVAVLLWQQNDNETGELSKAIKQKRQRLCPVYSAEVG